MVINNWNCVLACYTGFFVFIFGYLRRDSTNISRQHSVSYELMFGNCGCTSSSTITKWWWKRPKNILESFVKRMNPPPNIHENNENSFLFSSFFFFFLVLFEVMERKFTFFFPKDNITAEKKKILLFSLHFRPTNTMNGVIWKNHFWANRKVYRFNFDLLGWMTFPKFTINEIIISINVSCIN